MERELKLGLYKHYKGHVYRVIGIGKHSETLEPLGIYHRDGDEKDMWARPLSMFFDEVELDGKKTDRFRYLGG